MFWKKSPAARLVLLWSSKNVLWATKLSISKVFLQVCKIFTVVLNITSSYLKVAQSNQRTIQSKRLCGQIGTPVVSCRQCDSNIRLHNHNSPAVFSMPHATPLFPDKHPPHPTLHSLAYKYWPHAHNTPHRSPKWQTVLAMSTNGHFNALEVTGLVSGVIFTGPEFLIWILQRGQCPRAGEVAGWWDSPTHAHRGLSMSPLRPFPYNHTLTLHPFPPTFL